MSKLYFKGIFYLRIKDMSLFCETEAKTFYYTIKKRTFFVEVSQRFFYLR
jgi:hypothetical protein